MLTTSRRLARTIRSRLVVPLFDAVGELLLLLGVEQRRLVDLPEVRLQGVLAYLRQARQDGRKVRQAVLHLPPRTTAQQPAPALRQALLLHVIRVGGA